MPSCPALGDVSLGRWVQVVTAGRCHCEVMLVWGSFPSLRA